jgi:hypothetical protein
MLNKVLLILLLITTTSLPAQEIKPRLYFAVDARFFSANGRWIPSDLKDKAAHSSETQIDCDHKSKTCVEATAEYFSGHPHIFINYFEVIKWDENGIVATSDSAVCITETLLISFGDKSVSNTHSAKTLDNDKKEACKFLGFVGTETDRFIIKNSDQWIADPYGSNGK